MRAAGKAGTLVDPSHFLICQIESLWNAAECTLATLYMHDFHDEGDDDLSFELTDLLDDAIVKE